MTKQHFFWKLNSPEASFTFFITNDKRLVKQLHVSYWKPYIDFGIGIVSVLGSV